MASDVPPVAPLGLEASGGAPALPLGLNPFRSIVVTFLAFGLGIGLWAGGSAALLARTGVSPATFGLALTAFTCAYLLAMSAVSTLARLFGIKRVAIGSALAVVPTLAQLIGAQTALELIGGLLLYGLAGGVLDSAMNAQGVALERELRRPIMARLHGSASAGAAVGAILGSSLLTSGATWTAVGLELAAFVCAALAIAIAGTDDRRAQRSTTPVVKTKVLTRSLVVIGVVVGVSIASETAALTWSAPLLRADAPDLAAIAGLGGAFFSACQAALRLNADRLRARIADRTLIALSLGLAAAGLVIVALPLGFAVSVVGFAVVGFGTGAIVPCGFALAATRPGVSAAASVSAVAFFGLFARVPAPLVTGVIADAFSLSAAFLAIALLLLAALVAVLAFIPRAHVISQGSLP